MSKKKNILIIDDETVLADMYAYILRQAGHEAIHVPGGEAALEWLANSPAPHLILLDFGMPRMTGSQFMKELKKKHPQVLSSTKIVGFSNHPSGSPATKEFEGEVHDFKQKPVALEAFLVLVNNLLATL